MTWILSWLVGNPLGRTLAKIGLVIVMLGVAVLLIYKRGKKDEALSRTMATMKAMRERIDVDDEIRSMDIESRRLALKRWVR